MDINDALRKYDIIESNLLKLERLWEEIYELIPRGPEFGENPEYEEKCFQFREILKALPKIDDYEIKDCLYDFNTIGHMRLDAQEVGDIDCIIGTEEGIQEQGTIIRTYRLKFNNYRNQLVRDKVLDLINGFDQNLNKLKSYKINGRNKNLEFYDEWIEMKSIQSQLSILLGKNQNKIKRWSDLSRHLHFGALQDLTDIIDQDFPKIKESLNDVLYSKNEPLPMDVKDISEILKSKPTGKVITEFKWENLTPETFERLLYNLISSSNGYINPEWLTKTNAPDRGRDLSVTRMIDDELSGKESKRVIIQCKYYNSKSISLSDISTLPIQMKLWEPPRVDILIIATNSTFTTDAIEFIEKNNLSDSALNIIKWSGSHLESLLSKRPDLIAEFKLK